VVRVVHFGLLTSTVSVITKHACYKTYFECNDAATVAIVYE